MVSSEVLKLYIYLSSRTILTHEKKIIKYGIFIKRCFIITHKIFALNHYKLKAKLQ